MANALTYVGRSVGQSARNVVTRVPSLVVAFPEERAAGGFRVRQDTLDAASTDVFAGRAAFAGV